MGIDTCSRVDDDETVRDWEPVVVVVIVVVIVPAIVSPSRLVLGSGILPRRCAAVGATTDTGRGDPPAAAASWASSSSSSVTLGSVLRPSYGGGASPSSFRPSSMRTTPPLLPPPPSVARLIELAHAHRFAVRGCWRRVRRSAASERAADADADRPPGGRYADSARIVSGSWRPPKRSLAGLKRALTL